MLVGLGTNFPPIPSTKNAYLFVYTGTEQERFGDNDNIVNVSLTALGPTPGEET